MQILQVLTSNQRRGAELSAVTLRYALTARGHRATAVALADAVDGPRLDDVRVLSLGHPLSIGGLIKLRSLARGVDVVVGHGSTTLPALGIALVGLRVPFVYANIGDPLYWANTRAKRLRVRYMLARASGVAARSERSASDLHKVLRVPEQRIAVVPNGRDVDRFKPAGLGERERLREEADLPAAVRVIACVGALSPEKRVDLALQACAHVPQCFLLIVGDGPERAGLEALAHRLGLPHKFLGSVDDVPAVLRMSDLLLLTSASEGLPGVLIEAGLCSLPVVTTDVGFVRDIVEHGVTGLVVDSATPERVAFAVEKALTSRVRMGTSARKRCLEHFDMRNVAERWERLLMAAIACRAAGDV